MAKQVIKLVEAGTGIIIITHYNRILKWLKPDFVHIIKNGSILKTSDKNILNNLEKNGFNF